MHLGVLIRQCQNLYVGDIVNIVVAAFTFPGFFPIPILYWVNLGAKVSLFFHSTLLNSEIMTTWKKKGGGEQQWVPLCDIIT